MSVHSVEHDFAATRRTLVSFVCVLAALIVLDSAGDAVQGSVFQALPWLAPLVAGVLVAAAARVSFVSAWRLRSKGR